MRNETMTRTTTALTILTAFACCASLFPSAAAAEPAGPDVDELCQAVAAYRVGQDEKPLIAVSELVRRSWKDPKQRRAIEDRLARLLASGTDDCKRFVCRQLWMAASARSVPALAKLLADEKLSDAARYALERLADPAAAAALRDALSKTKGRTLVGVVNSLGHRRDRDAVGLLLPVLGSEDQAVVAAAAWSLGRIGGADAAKALLSARAASAGKARRILDDACLLCADTLVADGEKADAAAVYRQMYAADEPRRIRIAALRGLMIAQPDKAGSLALEAMKGPDPQISGVAGALLRKLPGEAITKALAAGLPALDHDGQIKMLSVLAHRADVGARAAVLAATNNKDQHVRLAAVTALGRVGTAEDVPLLTGIACKGAGPLRDAARGSLIGLRRAGVEAALTALLRKSPPPIKAELIRLLAARWAAGAVPQVLALASDSDAAVRAAALATLGKLAGERELPALLGLLVDATTDADRAAAAGAIASVAGRAKDKPACAAVVLNSWKGAKQTPARCALLGLLPRVPAPSALAAVRGALGDADAPVRAAAARALADWPTAAALDDLLKLAATGSDTHKVLAVRGCVRLLSLPADRSPGATAALYAKLMKLAKRPQEKRLVLAGLATVGHVDALRLIEALLSDAALAAEAQVAAVRSARAVAAADYELATAVLKKIAASNAGERVKADAAAALDHINRHRDYVQAWMLSGPYTQKGKNGPELFHVAFAPEQVGAKAKWRPVTVADGFAVDLRALLGGENRCAYLRTTLISPRKQDVVLELGSDDGIKVWLGGKLVHANNASRGLKPGEDSAKITLRPGRNVLMLKINNGSTDWGACARVTGLDGKPIRGLRVATE
jgi:HEAT repeat protein